MEDELEDGELVLCEKEPQYPKVDLEDLSETIADRIADNDSDCTGRDDYDSVYDAVVKAVKSSNLDKILKKEMKQFEYWEFSTIKLIP